MSGLHQFRSHLPIDVQFAMILRVKADGIDWHRAVSEIVRELRGARTQKALSRALGYRSNVVFSWESGRDVPGMTAFLELLAQVGREPRAWLTEFGRSDVPERLTSAQDLALYAGKLNRGRSLKELAAALGESRYVVSRWLSGKTELRAPDFFRLVDITTLSALDLVNLLVDARRVPSIAAAHERLEAARSSARERPWSHAIVHMVELPSYRALACHEPGWFASRLGISVQEEADCLELLVRMGRLGFDGQSYTSTGTLSVDTRPDPEATRRLASFWMHQGAERALVPGSGRYAFNAFGVKKTDLQRISELQRRYFAELRAIVADSEATEAVAVATFQLFALTQDE